MKRRRVIHVKSKPRTVSSTRRRAHKKNVAAVITHRNTVFRMSLDKERVAAELEAESET